MTLTLLTATRDVDHSQAAVLAQLLRQAAEPAEPEGGEAACFAHLVCPECGAVVSEGHAPGCGSRALRLYEGAEAGDGAADDQGVDFAGAFVGVDGLGVGDEAAHVVLQQDAVPAEEFARPADMVSRIRTVQNALASAEW